METHYDSPLIPSAFLGLPLEIRRTIYQYVLLPSPEHRQVLRPLLARCPNSWWGAEEISRILRVNKHLHYKQRYTIQVHRVLISGSDALLNRRVSRKYQSKRTISDTVCLVFSHDESQGQRFCQTKLYWELEGLLPCSVRGNAELEEDRFSSPVSPWWIVEDCFIESILELSRELDNGEPEVSLLLYDGSCSVDKQGDEIIEECKIKISQHLI